jgi:hypothetical protein
MEGTLEVSGSRVAVTPTMKIITSEIFPPNMSNQTTCVTQSTFFMSINNSAPLIVGSTHPLGVTMSLPSTTNPLLFGMSLIGMLNVLTGSQSTFQVPTVGLGNPLIPHQVFFWGGCHIPLSFPSLMSGAFLYSSTNPFGGWGTSMGSGFQYASIPSTSTLFTLYGGFRSNSFTTYLVSARGNPFHVQWNPMQGYFSSQGMSSGGNPFLSQWNTMQGGFHSKGRFAEGNHVFPFMNHIGGSFLPFK